jgi:hypothetical protein
VDRSGAYTYTNRRLSTLLPDRDSDIVGLSFEEALGPVSNRLRPTLDRALQGEASVLEFTEPASGRRIRTAFTPDQIGEGRADQRRLPAVHRRDRGGAGARRPCPDPQTRIGRAADQAASPMTSPTS